MRGEVWRGDARIRTDSASGETYAPPREEVVWLARRMNVRTRELETLGIFVAASRKEAECVAWNRWRCEVAEESGSPEEIAMAPTPST
jgi:hypothetical protein